MPRTALAPPAQPMESSSKGSSLEEGEVVVVDTTPAVEQPAESSSSTEVMQDTSAALENALSVLRERVAVVDQIVASSPAKRGAAPVCDTPPPATPTMHTPLGSPATTPMATPMEVPAEEQDSRIQTTVLSDAEIAEMVAQGAPPPAPTSAQKLRGLGAKLAESLVALSPARAAAAPAGSSSCAVSEDVSPTECMRLENCRERGLPDNATWNDIADYDMALSPQDIEERRKDTVGRLLRLATAKDEFPSSEIHAENTSGAGEQMQSKTQRGSCGRGSPVCVTRSREGAVAREETEPREDVELPQQTATQDAPDEVELSRQPSRNAGKPAELSELLDEFQTLALATPAALPSAPACTTPEAQDTPESGTPSCGDTRGSSDSFGSVQSGSFLNDSCSPVAADVRRAGAGRRRGGSIDAALAMLPGTPREYDIDEEEVEEEEDTDTDEAGEATVAEAEPEGGQEAQVDQATKPLDLSGNSGRMDHMDISLHSVVPPPPRDDHHDISYAELSPSMLAAQCVLDGDHIGAKLALASVPGSGDKVMSADTSAATLEDSFAIAEAEALQQAEESFAAKQAQLEDSFAAAEAEADKSPADAVCSAFGEDFGQLLAEARQLVGTGKQVVSPVLAPHSPQQLGSPHSHVETAHSSADLPPATSNAVSNENVDAPSGTVEEGNANQVTSELLQVGDRCEVVLQGKCQKGTICFLGPAPLLGIGEWAGVKLDQPSGKHDGSVQGKRYFQCKARHGVLLKQERVKPSIESPDVATGPVTRSKAAAAAARAAKVTSTTANRFLQRASEQVQAVASDPTSPLHSTDVDFSELVAEARQLAGEVELSDLRRSTMQSPAATPSQLSSKKQVNRAKSRGSVDTASATAAGATESVAMPTPEHAAEAEAELYLLKRKLRVLWKDMGRQSLRRVLKRSCPSGEVQYDDFLQALRIGGHINAKSLSDLELRRLFRGAKLESCAPGTTVSTHDITPLAVDALVSFLGLGTTHAEPKQKDVDATAADLDATAANGDEIDFRALLREAREVIGAIPVVKSPPSTTATVATVATVARSGKPRATATATATARVAVGARSGTDEPTSASASVDHSKPKLKQPRRPLSAPKQRYVPSATKQSGRTSAARARSRGPIRSRTPDARSRPSSASRAASNARERRAASVSSRPRPSTAQVAAAEERDLDASPKELSYAERALADAQRRQAWREKQQEAQQERARTAASGRPGGKPVRKRTPAAQARFLEQMDQNEQARKQRLSEMRKEASREVQSKVLKNKPSIPKSSKKILAESSNGQRRRPSGNFLSRSDQLLKEKRQREQELAEQKAALERRESAKKAVDRPTDSFLQRAEAWEKQKRLRAFAAHQRDPVGPPSDENQQPREDKHSASKKARPGGRVRQQPRQTLRF